MNVYERKINAVVPTSLGPARVSRVVDLECASVAEVLTTKPTVAYNTDCSVSWNGTSSRAELDKYVRDGWPAMERRMLAKLDSIELPAAAQRVEIKRKRRRVKGDFGNEVDIHAIRQGKLDTAWTRTVMEQRETVGNRLVHVVINMAARSTDYFDDALWAGAAVLRIYEALTSMGKSVAITMTSGTHNRYSTGEMSFVSCRVKNYGEPMDTVKLASLVNLGFYRMYLMRHLAACHPTLRRRYDGGMPADTYAVLPWSAQMDKEAGAAVVMIGRCYSESAAKQIVANFMAQYINPDAEVHGEFGRETVMSV